ncbi:hypothetical protein C4552_03080 [Candidatus Parcubacteria bacterium]|nr:MAG: hypothetical protein C4552_03080 [Candidatus Parcubacteria bacterium]
MTSSFEAVCGSCRTPLSEESHVLHECDVSSSRMSR